MTEQSNATVRLDDLTFDIYLEPADISAKVQSMASQINLHYAGKEIVLIGVLKGAFVFMAELMKRINLPTEIEFIRVSSYKGTSSTGDLKLSTDYPTSIKGKHVILVEDIVDTGLTAQYLLERAQKFEPASVTMASLFVKPECVKTDVEIAFVGFEIPNHFIVGYGMDYNEKGRELGSVYKIVD